MTIDIRLMGPPSVRHDGRPVLAPRGQKAWGLLAFLLLGERPFTRHYLAHLLFGDAADPMSALRWNLVELRRVLGDPLRGAELALAPTLLAGADVRLLLDGDRNAALALPGLKRDLLEGMSFAASPSFDVWLTMQRRHLRAAANRLSKHGAPSLPLEGLGAVDLTPGSQVDRRDSIDGGVQELLVY